MKENIRLEGKNLEKSLMMQGFDDELLEQTLNEIDEINQLKKEKNAVVLAHYYMIDALKEGVADYIGDSLELAKIAKQTDADEIVFCGVHFMAETAKILNPQKRVLLPDLGAGCSLAESITAQDVRNMREENPNIPFVAYINTSADVKAEVDLIVTSSNAKKIISELDSKRVAYIPDKLMAQNLAAELPEKEIVIWDGTCIVHEQFTPGYMDALRNQVQNIKILAHPECPPEVAGVSDFVGSTSAMLNYVKNNGDRNPYFLATECGLGATIQSQMPEIRVEGSCTKCPYMKMIDVTNTLDALRNNQHEINVDERVASGARRALDRMLELS